MKEVLSVDVVIDGINEVKSENGSATMISFHGTSDCDNFKGTILPGGVDTQKGYPTGVRTLSARYILEGEDFEGKNCRIFIENNGYVLSDGSIETTPVIFTDSKALGWLTTAELQGTVTPTKDGVRISILAEDE